MMAPILDDDSGGLPGPLIALMAGVAVYTLGLGALAFKVLSTPARRRERTQSLLDLLEIGFRNGRSPERTFVEATETLDPSLPPHFHIAAAQIRGGAKLSEALETIPSEIPPQLAAAIRVGEELGDVQKVLPACRELFRDTDSQTRSGFDFMVISNLILLPTVPLLLPLLNYIVLPHFLQLYRTFGGSLPESLIFLIHHSMLIAGVQAALAAMILAWFILRLWSPNVRRIERVDQLEMPSRPPFWKTSTWHFVKWTITPLRDWIVVAVPWTRRRLQRDFCAMLSLLLDAGVAEPQAVAFAAESTANLIFIRRARRALADLSAGKNLQAALRRFDSAGEFSWRLKNAVESPDGFSAALAGWMEALGAKAFQQEQTVSQVTTSGLVLCNGLVVGAIVTGVFGMLISFMQ